MPRLIPRLPLNALRAFETVARCGGFGAAAKELHVSQSAVSHQIKHLEEWFGAPLFERSGGRPQMLPHAEALARALTSSLSGIDAACTRARRSTGPNTLVIASIPSIAVCWLIPRLRDLRVSHPEIHVRLIYAFHGHEIDYGDVDLAFVYGPEPEVPPGARYHDVLPGAATPVCSPGVLEAMGEVPGVVPGDASLADCADHIDFLHDTDTSGWARWFARAGITIDAVPTGPVFEDFNLLRAAALAGQGVALCPPAMLTEDLAEGRLVQLSGTVVDEHHRYWLIERDADDEATAALSTVFIRWLFNTHAEHD
jgi:DNA-binding transcriptional LysR family regulator